MNEKQQEQQGYINEYNKSIERAESLLAGLLIYNKNIINKTFFEKYFTLKVTEQELEYNKDYKLGEPRKDWKGNILTDFKLSNKDFTWQKGKRIHLYQSHYVDDIESNNKDHIIEKTKETIDNLKRWRDGAIVKRDLYKNFKLEEFKNEYKKLLEKYNGVDINYEIIEQIRFV
jgi:hypothetical protein